MSKHTDPILPIRFRLNAETLRQQEIATFDLPWINDLERALNYLYSKEGGKKNIYEKPPYATLNAAIASLSPVFAHGFLANWDPINKIEKRQAAALNKIPSSALIKEVFFAWAQSWINYRFSEIAEEHRNYAIKIIAEVLAKPFPDWIKKNAYDVFMNPEDNGRYRAIPSLLASMMSGKSSIINNTKVDWGLCLYEDKLVVVSNPQFHNRVNDEGKEIQGVFAYQIRFSLQTQGRDDEPWIQTEIRCQRYMDRPVKKLNFGRAASILVQMSQPRKDGWPFAETMVQIPVYGGPKRSRYSDCLPEILEYLNARALETPTNIMENPGEFFKDKEESLDRYYLVYAEGYRPKHTLKSGFSPREKAQVVNAILEIFGDVLKPGKPLQQDSKTAVSIPIPLLNWRRLQKRSLVKRSGDLSTEENEVKSIEAQVSYRLSALQRALRGKTARVLILYSNEQTKQAIEWAIARTYLMGTERSFPDWFLIEASPVSGDLVEPLCGDIKAAEDLNQPGVSYTEKKKKKKEFEKELRLQTENRIKSWCSYLEKLSANPKETERTFVIAELPDLPDGYIETQSVHHVIRAACVRLGFASQMITSVDATLEDIQRVDSGELFSGKPVEERSKTLSAVHDLLIRQPGIVGAGITETTYRKAANLPESLANDLVMIGIYRGRKSGADYPMAVRLCPEGYCEAKVPNQPWMEYLDATLKVGEVFRTKNGGRLKQQDLTSFLKTIVEDPGSCTTNTIILVMADDWRTKIWPGLGNNKLGINSIEFPQKDSPIESPIFPADYPKLRIIRLREGGSLGETPQYIRSKTTVWSEGMHADNVRGGGGFLDNDHLNPDALHYFSIGDLESIKDERLDSFKTEEGGDKAYRMESIIEMLPIFYQPSDVSNPEKDKDELPIFYRFCRSAHFLRHSPAWDGGTTNYPYPLHLAEACIDDMLCLLDFQETDGN